MNAYQVYQKGSTDNASLGCLGPFISLFVMMVVEEVFFPRMNFFLFVIMWHVLSIFFMGIIMIVAQKFWDDQWKDSCLTRGGMKI